MNEMTHANFIRARNPGPASSAQPFPGCLGVRDSIDPSLGDGYRDLIDLSDDVFITINNFGTRQDIVKHLAGEDSLKLHWQISGHSFSQFSNGAAGELRGATLGLLTQPAGIAEQERSRAGSREISATVCVTRNLLIEKLNIDPADVPTIVRSFLEQTRTRFAGGQWSLPPRLAAILGELVQPPLIGSLYTAFLEARVYDLLWFTFSHLRSLESTEPRSIKLSARDRDCINEARLLLERNPTDENLCLAALCRRVGVNRNKMQYGFRVLFGVSPASYRSSLCLNHARRLLKETDESIAVIASRSGYTHQSTFASAFKRHFGISPRQARQ
jgi:AraC-like DNA-binding protein